jgi:hypothetical protein
VSFCYLTNGLAADIIREARPKIGLSTRASATARAPTGDSVRDIPRIRRPK